MTLLKVSISLSWVTTEKLFSCDGLRPRLTRSAAMTSSWAWATVAESIGSTTKSIQPLNQSATLVNVVCGMFTIGLEAPPNRLAASA